MHARIPRHDGLSRLLCPEAPDREVSGHTPLLLEAGCLLVVEGTVDVFLVALGPGNAPTGLRRHLLTLSPGEIAFDFDGSLAVPPIGFLAVGTVGSRVRAAPAGRIADLGRDPAARPHLCRAVEAWVRGLSRAMARLVVPAPRPDLRIAAGETVEVPADCRLSAEGGMPWIDCGGVDPLYLDSDHVALENGIPLPLDESCFVRLPAGRAVTAAGTAAVVEDGRCWPALAAFHRAVAEILPLNLRLARVDEHNRLKDRERADVRSAGKALEHLAAPLSGAAAHHPLDPAADPLVQACAAVAAAMGHAFEAPGRRDEEGGAAQSLAAIVRANRLRTRRLVLEEGWWRADVGPFLLLAHPGGRPLAVLPGPSAGSYLLHDPAVAGPPRRLTAAQAAGLEGEAFSFYVPFPDRPLSGLDVGGGAFRWSRADTRSPSSC